MLTPLADVIGIPPPVGIAMSIGDVLLYAGVGMVVIAVMLGRSARIVDLPLLVPGVSGEAPRPGRYWRLPGPSPLLPVLAVHGLLLQQRIGNLTVIVVPWPGALSTSNVPPPTCARSRIIAMPK